jgi:hemerythrin-like metal-binding protein
MGKNIAVLGLAIAGLALAVIAVFGFMAGPTTYWAWVAVILLAGIYWLHRRLTAQGYLTWKDSYSVGVQALDDDHKRLLHLINNLYTAANYRTDMAFERQALNEVIDYTKTHFAREEELMRANEYPDFEPHKRQHEAMIAKVNELMARYEQDRDGTVEELLKYLREWLIQHILGTDQGYRGHLTSRGVH